MIPIILLYFLRLCVCQAPEPVYVVNMESQMEVCDEESTDSVDTSNVIVGRFNETIAYMHGDIKFLKDVGHNTMLEIIVEKEASGKYELMFQHEVCDLCGEIEKGIDSDYHRYMKYFAIPDSCPFEAGDYAIKEFIIDTDELPVNGNTCGRYKAYLNLYENPEKDCKTNKRFLFCLTLNLAIEVA